MVNSHPSLVLTGFMGTGKTSVGKIIAQKLRREFVDMDALIESRQQKSVSEIFAAHGEAYFRARESELCAELGTRENLVIATGGGALVAEENSSQFVRAFIVCLDTSVEEIVARLERRTDRPLLQGNQRERAAELLMARRAAYARIDRHVATTGKSVEQVADEIIALYQGKGIHAY